MSFSLVALTLFLCITFPILIITVLSNAYLKKQNEDFEKNLEVQADHYKALAKSNYELRRFRHDFRNVQIGLKKTLADQDCQAALAMLESGQTHLFDATEAIVPYDTGNGIVDAILADKQAKAREDGIAITFSGSVPSQGLSPIDLCVIFGNTLDNAVEACQKISLDRERIITVSSQCNSGFIFISITNPVLENVTIHNNSIETTKNDRSLHGYGLHSLKETAQKYDGELKLVSENKMFEIDIDLCIQTA